MSLAFTENVEFFRPNRQRHSFGTRGSQVQILPLRSKECSKISDFLNQQIGVLLYVHSFVHRFPSVRDPKPALRFDPGTHSVSWSCLLS